MPYKRLIRAVRPRPALASAAISLIPSGIVPFVVPFGSTASLFQFLTLQNVGAGSLASPAVSAITYLTGDPDWITNLTTNGAVVAITANASGIAVGTHTATFDVTDVNAGNSPFPVVASLEVTSTAAAPAISISGGTGNFVFSSAEGTGTLAAHTRNVSNEYGVLGDLGTVTVTGQSAAWINASYAAGVLTIEPIIDGLTPGTYVGTLSLSATGAANSPRLMPPVTLTITPAPAPAVLSLAPQNLQQTAVQGDPNPADQTVTLSNSGTGGAGALGNLTLSAIQFQQGVGWCSAVLFGATITVSYNSFALANGTYNAILPVNASGASNTPVNLPISLTITGGGGPGAVIAPSFTLPSGLSFNSTLRRLVGVPTGCTNVDPATMFHGGAADHVCATANDFTTALANCVDGDIIELTADLLTGSGFQLRNRGTAGWVWIRSDAYASLPAYNSDINTAGVADRIDPAVHGSFLRALRVTATNGHSIHCAAGARGYVFTGIECTPDTPSVTIADNIVDFCVASNIVTNTSANLIRDMVFERGYVHANPATGGNVQRAFWIDGERITIAHSVMRGIQMFPGAGENQAIGGTQWKFGLVFNNEIDGSTENVLLGFNVPSGIPGYMPEDLAFIRNYIPKQTYNTAWVKNWFELKGARRVLLYGNYFFFYRRGAQTRAIVLTPDPNQEIRDITYMGNIFDGDGSDGGVANLGAQGSGAFVNLGSSRIEWLHNDVRNFNNAGTFSIFRLFGGAQSTNWHYDSVHIHHNALAHWNAAVQGFEDLTQMLDFWFKNNVFKNRCTFGQVFASDGSNETALNLHSGAGNWQVRNNVGISGAALWGTLANAPHNNALTTSADLFTDAGNGDWTINVNGTGNGGASFKGFADDGTDPGPDWAFLNTATANVRP